MIGTCTLACIQLSIGLFWIQQYHLTFFCKLPVISSRLDFESSSSILLVFDAFTRFDTNVMKLTYETNVIDTCEKCHSMTNMTTMRNMTNMT